MERKHNRIIHRQATCWKCLPCQRVFQHVKGTSTRLACHHYKEMEIGMKRNINYSAYKGHLRGRILGWEPTDETQGFFHS